MNKTDPLLTYRPLDCDVEAEWTPERSTRVLEHILSSANGTRGRQKFTATNKKAWALSSLAIAGVAAATAAVVTLPGNQSRSSRTTPDAVGPTPTATDSLSTGKAIVLAGYKIALPANYTIGKDDTNCTADLHLTAQEVSRLVTTPNADCPLLIKSVEKSLPSGALSLPLGRFHIDANGAVTTTQADPNATLSIYAVVDGPTVTVYLPARLPDGPTVYVTVDSTNVKASVQTDGTVQFLVGPDWQLLQLEYGLHVERALPDNGRPTN